MSIHIYSELYAHCCDLVYHQVVLLPCQRKFSSDQKKQSTDQLWQDRRTCVMASRKQRPAPASNSSAEAKRRDMRTNEKKCCEFFRFCVQKLKCKNDTSYVPFINDWTLTCGVNVKSILWMRVHSLWVIVSTTQGFSHHILLNVIFDAPFVLTSIYTVCWYILKGT